MNDSTTRRLGVREIPQGSELSSCPLRSGALDPRCSTIRGGSIKGLYHFQSLSQRLGPVQLLSAGRGEEYADGPHSQWHLRA